MADSFHSEPVDDAPASGTTGGADDVEMAENPGNPNPNNKNDSGDQLPFAEGVPEGEDSVVPDRVTFLQNLASPVVTLLIGAGERETILTAHQGLLVQSPYFAEACGEFADDGSVGVFLLFLLWLLGVLLVGGESAGLGG